MSTVYRWKSCHCNLYEFLFGWPKCNRLEENDSILGIFLIREGALFSSVNWHSYASYVSWWKKKQKTFIYITAQTEIYSPLTLCKRIFNFHRIALDVQQKRAKCIWSSPVICDCQRLYIWNFSFHLRLWSFVLALNHVRITRYSTIDLYSTYSLNKILSMWIVEMLWRCDRPMTLHICLLQWKA